MPGLGARVGFGVATEVTEGVAIVPASSVFLPISGESNKANRPTIMSSSLSQDRMVQTVMNGIQAAEGGYDQPFDGASVGQGIWLFDGDSGYSSSATPGKLATISSATALTGTGTLAAGTYFYKLATLLQQVNNSDYVYMPASAEISATLASAGQITLAYTAPGTYPDGFIFAGVVAFRSDTTGTQKYLGYKLGSGSFVDNGSYTVDLAISPYTATLVTHEFRGTQPATSVDPLSTFTASVYKDNDQSEQYVGNRMDTFGLSISDKNQELMAKFTYKGIRYQTVANFTASYAILESFMGWQCTAYVDGVKDCTIQSITLDAKNNVQYLDGLCGVPEARGTIAGRREISVSMDRQFLDHSFMNKMLDGAEAVFKINSFGQPVVSGYSANSTSKSTHGLKIVPFRHWLQIDLPRVRFKQAGGQVSGPDQIKESIQADCFKSLAEGSDMIITLINTVSVYA